MHLVLKCCRIAFNQQGRVFRDRIEQRREPGLVGLGEITEDMGMNQSLVTRMANPQTHPRIMRADMGGDRADAPTSNRSRAVPFGASGPVPSIRLDVGRARTGGTDRPYGGADLQVGR